MKSTQKMYANEYKHALVGLVLTEIASNNIGKKFGFSYFLPIMQSVEPISPYGHAVVSNSFQETGYWRITRA